MLDLIRLSSSRLFPPGGVDLYRQIALLTEMSQGDEVLDVACGKGVSIEYFVRKYGVHGAGVDEDSRLVDEAEARARAEGLSANLQFQTGRADSLPYRDAIFDVTVGEIGLAAHCDPADAVRELVRVTKPGGTVVLVQLIWKAPVAEAQQRVLSDHLGVRPMILVEWRRLLRDAGVTDIHTEGWSDEETSFRPKVTKPFPDFAEIFSIWEKIAILRRARARWGWRGVRTVLEREWEVHRLLSKERILGLDLLKGRKTVPDAGGDRVEGARLPGAAAPPAAPGARDARSRAPVPSTADEGTRPDTAGLPLFTKERVPNRRDETK